MNQHLPELLIILFFLLSVGLQVWIVYKARESRKLIWFLISFVISVFIIGIIKAPLSSLVTFIILCFFKNEEGVSVAKQVVNQLVHLVFNTFSAAFYIIILVLPVGSLYWLWMAIQLKSFTMFLVGIIPLSWLITVPVGIYSLMFDIPDWVYEFFGK